MLEVHDSFTILCYSRLEASHIVNLHHSGSMEWADPTQTVALDPNKKGQNVMALPLLIVLAALLLWTLIPEPDQDADPVEPPRQ